MNPSHIAAFVRKALYNYRVSRQISNRFWALQVRQANADPSSLTCPRDGQSLEIHDLQLNLFRSEHSFVLKGLMFARALHEAAHANFENVDDQIVVRLQDVSFEVRTFEELFILHEIFVEGIYNLQLPASAVVVDIGANVGFSSIFFARNPMVERVIAYEPVGITYQHALRNVTLNSAQAGKIELRNVGLSDKAETVDVDVSDEVKGSVGIRGLAHRDDIDRDRIRSESITLRAAGPEIAEMLNDCDTQFVMLKIDCEGSEYRIVDSLLHADQLKRVACIVMEWHDPLRLSELETKLASAGFIVFSRFPNGANVGMIYASRSVTQQL